MWKTNSCTPFKFNSKVTCWILAEKVNWIFTWFLSVSKWKREKMRKVMYICMFVSDGVILLFSSAPDPVRFVYVYVFRMAWRHIIWKFSNYFTKCQRRKVSRLTLVHLRFLVNGSNGPAHKHTHIYIYYYFGTEPHHISPTMFVYLYLI